MKSRQNVQYLLQFAAISEIIIAFVLGTITLLHVRNSSDALKFFAEGGATAGAYGLILLSGVIIRAAIGVFGILSRIKPLLIFFGIVLIFMSVPSRTADFMMIAVRILALAISILYLLCGIFLKTKENTMPDQKDPPYSNSL